MTRNSDLEEIFHPKSIAVVGARRVKMKDGWLGIFGGIKNHGYPGRLYPINPNASEVDGLKAYPNLTSLPEPVDLVVVSVPAPAVPDVLKECIATGNKNVHIFTSGFKETGEEEGIRLQAEIEEIALEGGLRVIGPNCMGVFVPKERLATWTDASFKSGSVAFISQSGGYAQDFGSIANQLEIYFSKMVSFGNALTLNGADFLEYFGDDPDTKIIAMYLEGIKDGRKMLRLVKETNRTKPVVIFKGGTTEAGTKAVASHTGSLAGEKYIWDAFLKQTGATPAYSLDDMAHVVLAFLHLKKTQGRGVAIIGAGGGISVNAADACGRAGLDLVPFSADMVKELRSFIPAAGNMLRNPVDAEPVFLDSSLLARALDLISSEPSVNMLIIYLNDWLCREQISSQRKKLIEFLSGAAREHTHDKPYVICWRSILADPDIKRIGESVQKELLSAGIPVYKDLDQAAVSLAKFAAYHEFLRKDGGRD